MVSGQARSADVLCLLLFVTGLFISGSGIGIPTAEARPPCPVKDVVGPCPVPPPAPNPLTTPAPTPTPARGPTATPAPGPTATPGGGNDSGGGPPRRGPTDRRGGGNSSGGGSGNPFPTPEEMLKGWLKYIVKSIADGIEMLIGGFNHIIFGLPAPGSPTAPTSWSSPSDGWWPSAWKLYLLFTPLGAFAAITAATLAASRPPTKRRAWLRDALKALVMIAFGWYIAAAGLHLGNELSMALAPSTGEFLATPEGMTKLGFGLILAAAVAVFEVAVIGWALVLLFIQWFLAHVLVGFWPLFWGFRALPSNTARPFADVGVAGLATLIVLKIFQAGILRFMFEIPWGLNSPLTTVMSLLGTAVGLIVATVILPVVGIKKLLPAAMIVAGKRHAPEGQKIERLRERTRDRVGGVFERYRGGGTTGGGGGADRRQVGTVQRRVASYSRPGGNPGSATRSGDASGWGSTAVGPSGRQPPEHDNRGYR